MDDISVADAVTLTIQAGTVVKFAPNVQTADMEQLNAVDIFVFGELLVEGTSGSPVTFTSAATSPVAGDWGSIAFYSGSSPFSRISNSMFSYPKYAIHSKGSEQTIDNNTFSNSSLEHIYVRSGKPVIEYNVFSACSSSTYCLKTETSSPVIIRNNRFVSSNKGISIWSPAIIVGNEFDGLTEIAVGTSTGSDGVIIKDNNIMNSGVGIKTWLDGKTIDATHNYLDSNTIDTDTDCITGCSITAAYPLSDTVDWMLEISSIVLKTDNTYNEDLGSNTIPGANLYMQLSGTDNDSSNINTTVAKVYSSGTDTTGIYVQMRETSASSGIYRGSARLDTISDQASDKIGAGASETVTVVSVRDSTVFDTVSIFEDTTPPSDIATVNDGLGVDAAATTNKTQLSANWTASTDDGSGISKYWYAIGTATETWSIAATAWATDTVDWTDNTKKTFVVRSGLNLTEGETYYFTVKAENGAGLQSNTTTSNGQKLVYSSTPQAISISQGWNLTGISKQDFVLQPQYVFATDSYEIFSYDNQYSALTENALLDMEFTGGYWIYSNTELEDITLGGNICEESTYDVNLSIGWNLFSIPYEEVIEWNTGNVTFTCGGQPAALVPIYYYQNNEYTKIEQDSPLYVFPWTGYWIIVNDTCTLTFTKP